MGYHLNRLDEPVLMAVSKPMQTEFGIHHRLDSCDILNQLPFCTDILTNIFDMYVI